MQQKATLMRNLYIYIKLKVDKCKKIIKLCIYEQII